MKPSLEISRILRRDERLYHREYRIPRDLWATLSKPNATSGNYRSVRRTLHGAHILNPFFCIYLVCSHSVARSLHSVCLLTRISLNPTSASFTWLIRQRGGGRRHDRDTQDFVSGRTATYATGSEDTSRFTKSSSVLLPWTRRFKIVIHALAVHPGVDRMNNYQGTPGAPEYIPCNLLASSHLISSHHHQGFLYVERIMLRSL